MSCRVVCSLVLFIRHFFENSNTFAVFPILADVVEVKTGSRSTAHWSNVFIRRNGWLRNIFAQLITPLDKDGIGQNWEDSNILEVLLCGEGSNMVLCMPSHLVLKAFGGNLKIARLGASTEKQDVHHFPTMPRCIFSRIYVDKKTKIKKQTLQLTCFIAHRTPTTPYSPSRASRTLCTMPSNSSGPTFSMAPFPSTIRDSTS